jgi:Cu/Ag efflux pump CusA
VAISLTGLGVSLASLVGLLAVYGIAARNGVLLIKHFQRLEYEENETFGEQLVLRGSRERAVPVMTMALTLGLALVPMLFRGSIAGGEMLYPMAVVVIGGLITSTLVTLFVVPALYLRFGAGREDREPAIDEPAVNEPAISQPAS